MDKKEKQATINMGLEPEVVFNTLSDLTILSVQTEDTHESLMEISGYDLNVKFNRDKIKDLADMENLLDGIKDLFRKIIMKDLLETDQSK